jgi:hypothetical protein
LTLTDGVLDAFEANGSDRNPQNIMTKVSKESEAKKEQRAREGAQAWAEYQAEVRATQAKTARLRALRLARDAAIKSPADVKKKKK